MPRSRWRRAWRAVVLALVAGSAVPAGAQPVPPGDSPAAVGCDRPPAFYEARRYTVSRVAVSSPFDFFRPIRRSLEAERAALPIREGEPYTGAAVTKATVQLTSRAEGWSIDERSPIKLDVVVAEIEDCRPQGDSGTLTVHLRVYGSRLPLRYTRLFGSSAAAGVGPMDAAGLARASAIRLEPSFAYSRSDKLSAGVAAQARRLGFVDTLDGRVMASSRAHDVSVSAAGTRDVDVLGLRALDWRIGYLDQDLPIAGGSRTSRAFSGLLSAVLTDLPGGTLLRTGGAVEIGRAAGDVDPATLAPGTVAAADVAALKGYATAHWRVGRQTASLGYGFEASATGNGFGDGYTRQLVDGSYRLRLLPFDHRPIDIDARANAGWIANHGTMPQAARFFGGNAIEEFLPAAGVALRANPYIRSLARSELDRVSEGAPLGGERFVAFNLTVAPTVWGRSMVPRELREDPTFEGLVTSRLGDAEKRLEQHYASETPAFAAFVREQADALRTALETPLDAAASRLEALESGSEERRDACEAALLVLTVSVPDLQPDDVGKALTLFRSLANPGGAFDEALGCLIDPALAPGDPAFTRAAAALRDAKARMRVALTRVDERQTQARARDAMAPATRVLDSFLHELNVASIAPVFTLDAARLGPQPAGGPGFRFGVGTGIRISLVNAVHVTAGFAWNVDRQPGERAGAAFVGLDVSEFLF